MAVRAQNGADLIFGIMAGALTATHFRLRKGSANLLDPGIKALSANVAVAAGERLRIPEGDLDLVYKRGDMADAHIQAAVESQLTSGDEIDVDLYTSSSAIISDSGYSQQGTSDWDFSTEADS